MPWVTLDGYEVIHTTEKAVLIKNVNGPTWVPRSVVLDGDEVVKGDETLVVEQWFVDQEGLD